MKKLIWATIALVCSVSLYGQNTKERLTEHVRILTADSLSGRQFGEPSALVAAEYVASEFADAGLEPYADGTYLQPFIAGDRQGYNVIGILWGNDPVLQNEWIILGAHFDHLGITDEGTVFHGADDNASGTAVLVETARNLSDRSGELARSVMFVAFDGEEAGLWGSRHLATHLPEGEVKFMASLDMVGWLKEGKLKIAGVAMLDEGEAIFANNDTEGLELKLKDFDSFFIGGSDHDPFASREIPAVHITTGMKSPYHKPADTADKIDYDGMTLITDYMTSRTVDMAGRDILASSGKASFKHGGQPEPLLITAGMSASLGGNFHHYKNGALEGKSGFAWNAGVWAQINLGNFFTLRPKVAFEQRNARWPLDFEDRTYARFHTDGIYVPLDLMFKFRMEKRSSMYAYLFVGGYYSRILGGKIGGDKIDFNTPGAGFNRDEWGMQWGAGFNIHRVSIEGSSRFGITRVVRRGGKITDRAGYFSVGYRF